MKTKPTINQLQHPQDVIDTHLRAALKPHARALLDAAAKDKQLEAEMDAAHPERVKEECERLFEQACVGDREADGVLRAAGGTQGYIEQHTRFFDLCRGKCRAGAKADAPLWQKASAAAVAALDAALVVVRDQWQHAQEALGEEPVRPSTWEDRIAAMRRAIEQTHFNAEQLQHGTNWQIHSLGLRRVLE